jgi:erythromycin esterase
MLRTHIATADHGVVTARHRVMHETFSLRPIGRIRLGRVRACANASIAHALAWFGALLFATAAAAQGREMPIDPAFRAWARTKAIAVPAVDAPYSDSAWAFLGPLVGTARVLAIGENIHGGHEPLALRNHLIRHAVTRLGFTAVAIESGFTDGQLVDRFVQGEPLGLDSVLRKGLNNGFGRLVENRDLLLWLRAHNETADKKVRFYGIDQTAAGAAVYTGAIAVEAVWRYLGPARAAPHRVAMAPLLDRFSANRFSELSPADRAALRRALADLRRAVGATEVSDGHAHALALRNVWAAERLEESFGASGTEGPRSLRAVRLRDSVMAENVRWVLAQQVAGGKVVVFAHNGHVWDVPMAFPAMGPAMTMMGTRLRRALGEQLRVIGTAAVTYEGMGNVLGDLSSMENAFARVVAPNHALDLRTADAIPAVKALLREPWITRIHAWLQPIVPRQATDILITLDRVTLTPMLPP